MSDHTIVIIRVVKILLDTKSWFIGKDPDAGKDWEQKEKGALENEIVDGITDRMDEFEQTLGDSEGHGNLAYCSPWGLKEMDVI